MMPDPPVEPVPFTSEEEVLAFLDLALAEEFARLDAEEAESDQGAAPIA